jgi:hypothetical protein
MGEQVLVGADHGVPRIHAQLLRIVSRRFDRDRMSDGFARAGHGVHRYAQGKAARRDRPEDVTVGALSVIKPFYLLSDD